jgi:hypothetical protein
VKFRKLKIFMFAAALTALELEVALELEKQQLNG